ncbi:MAG TPA: chromosome segregation protein SMC [Candidatus Binatia bacterium]|nr:chromosome segregation protein SMC [Candidatus Binatia bacterium]
MRLSRIEMVGFKSFAQKTVIELTPGITSIVGPNGCGKSNIVDALRWVMGEQSARHLRGHLMEDLVFNGSESLPPTGMAEVSLTFDNQDARGPAEYSSFSEIMVTRRLFRSGESEYAINKTPCRLKDVIELFLGTGVGTKAYSIVEQGRVEELVNSKPEERRALIEEAAGTSKYKSRKLVAERKLERTQQNLLRVTDIVREIERQIRSMELQARKAERYRALKSELREKDLSWGSMQGQALGEEISQNEMQLIDTESRLTEHLAVLRAREAESESIRLSLLEAEREINTQQEHVYQLKVQIQAEEQRVEFYNKDLSQLEQAETGTRAELLHLQEKLGALGQEVEELQKAKANFIQLSLFEESFLKEKEQELEKIQFQIQSLQKEIDREKEVLIETANQISYLKNDLLVNERRLEEIKGDRARSQQEHCTATRSRELAVQKRDETGRALEASLQHAKNATMEAKEMTASIRNLSKVREEQEKKVEVLKEQLQENRSRLISLEDLQKNYEGYQEGVRAIMLKREREATPNGIHGLVAEVLEAPEPYEKALTAVLGDRLQYIIVKGHAEGLEAIEYLKREASGRGSFIPLQLSRRERRPLPLSESEVVAPLLDMVTIKDGYRDVAEYLLSDVVVVRNLRAGLDLWNRNGFYSTLVTSEGEVIDPMGVVTGGSGAPLESSFLSQRRRIREIKLLITDLQAKLKTEEQQTEILKQQMDEAETKRSLLGQEIHRLELDRVRLEHEHSSARQEIERLDQTLESLAQEQTDLAAAIQLLVERLTQNHASIEAQCREKTEKQTALTQKLTAVTDLRDQGESLEADVTQSRIRNASLGEKRENTHLNLENRIKLQQEISGQVTTRKEQIVDLLEKRKQIEAERTEAERSVEHDRKRLQELDDRLQSERGKYREVSRHLAELEESIKEMRPLGEACQEEKNRLHLLLSEKRLNLQYLADSIRDKYDVDLRELSHETTAGSPSKEELLAEIDELRNRLERMGEVNLAAIGEFEELTGRFQFMNQQKEDLEKSIADLQRTITKLNRICRLRFRESFDQINEKFEAIFPRLFRGGKAKLVLTDENDYLETGVDIVVQPPGKKLQSITLLSGGEKALTAVSLLFAIFLTKPSPFCFLDEVDAPLDDANIDRFNELIKEMSERSQFVLVTHNKKTMQAAEVLYGITMEEPGVSKVVSVKLH